MTTTLGHGSSSPLRATLHRPETRLAAAAVVAWFACGMLNVLGTRYRLPTDLVGLVAPWTHATWAVHEPVRGLLGGALGAAALVGVLLVAARPALRAQDAGTGVRVLATWFAVVLGGVAAAVVGALAVPLTFGARGALASSLWADVRTAGGWGVAYGWLVTLAVLPHLRRTSRPRTAGDEGAVRVAVLAGGTAAVGWMVVAMLHATVESLVAQNVTTYRSPRAAALRSAADWLLPVSSATGARPVVVVVAGLLVGAVTAGLTWWAVRGGVGAAGRGLLVRAVWLAGTVAAVLGPVVVLLGPATYDPESAGPWLAAQRALLGPTDGGASGLLLGWVAALVAVWALRDPAAATHGSQATPATDAVTQELQAAVDAPPVLPPDPAGGDAENAEARTAPPDDARARRGLRAWTRDPRVLVPVLTLVALVAAGVASLVLTSTGLPAGLVGLVVPAPPGAGVVRGMHTGLWTWPLELAVLVGVAHLAARPAARAVASGVVPRALAVWFAVLVAGVAFSLVQAVVGVVAYASVPQADLRVLVAFDSFTPLRASAGWGVVYGGLVALVVARVAWRDERVPSPGPDPVARRAAVVAAVSVAGGWLVLTAGRAVVLDLLEEHGAAHPDLAWQVYAILGWVAPVPSTDGAGAGATVLSAVLVAALAGVLTDWTVTRWRAASTTGASRADSLVLVAGVWLVCVVATTLGPLPTVLVGPLPEGPYAAYSATTGGAAGLLYGWVVALVVRALATRGRVT